MRHVNSANVLLLCMVRAIITRSLFVMPSYIIHLAAFLALLAPHLALAQTDPFPQSRTATDWPFPWNSIWNHPIGDGAVYTPANIGLPTAYGMTVDEDILILTPDALPADVIAHDAGWDRNRTRCESIVSPLTVLESGLPIPGDFQTDPGYIGLTPNHSSAVLYADGVTVLESQPLHICESGAVVSQFVAGTMHLKEGDGIRGSHGGSGMSGIGGTIRVGELVPGGVIRHALKLNLFANKNLFYDEADPSPGYRWPALRNDGYANDPTHACRYNGQTPALVMAASSPCRPILTLRRLPLNPPKSSPLRCRTTAATWSTTPAGTSTPWPSNGALPAA